MSPNPRYELDPELVRDARVSCGLDQSEAAERAGVSLGTLRNIERGRVARPDPATLVALARIYGLRGGVEDFMVEVDG